MYKYKNRNLTSYKTTNIILILAWALIAILCIGVFIWSLSVRLSIFQQTCETLTQCLDPGQLLLEEELGLNKVGLKVNHYGIFRILIDFLQGFGIFIIAIIIFIKKYKDWFALFASISIMASGTVITISNVQTTYPSMSLLFNIIVFLASGYVVFFYIFPNGKFVPRWTRYVACLWLFFTLGRTFVKGSIIDPFTWQPVWNFSGWFAFHLIALFAQIYRFKYVSNTVEKQQTKWFLFGLAAMFLGIIGESIIDHSQHLLSPGISRVFINLLAEFFLGLLFMAIPLSIGIAMHDHRLWDIDYLISRTALYGMLSAGVIILYVAIVGGISVFFQSGGNLISSILASAIVAILFQPLRTILQRYINRVLYGERDNPYLVITQMGQRLESSLASHEIIPAAVQTLAKSLKLPYVAVFVEKDGEEFDIASFGNSQGTLINIPLVHQSIQMGSLRLSTRSIEEGFSRSEEKLLYDVAPQIGIAINNVRLTTDLQQARKKLVNAREEERKRLRRDLHDSLGPELAGLSMQMDATKNFLYQNPERASELLTQMNHKLKLTIEEIREIVYALRPPVLDEFGILYAIKAQVEKLNQTGNEIRITVEAPDYFPELPAAVEAAAYRITQEALTNVIKHSKAKTCLIHMWIDQNFYLEISDDGVGFSGDKKGIGYSSMKERAEELGGVCTISKEKSAGTRVFAELPIMEVE